MTQLLRRTGNVQVLSTWLLAQIYIHSRPLVFRTRALAALHTPSSGCTPSLLVLRENLNKNC